MSDSTPRLPNRPSLAQLRKQAKELVQQLRNGDPSATDRLRKCKPNVSDPILADAQFVLAREHGFESWPKLVHHIQAVQYPGLEQHRRIAEDLVAAYNSADPEAATRLNDLFHSALNLEQIRDFIRDKLFNLPDTQQRINNNVAQSRRLKASNRQRPPVSRSYAATARIDPGRSDHGPWSRSAGPFARTACIPDVLARQHH